MPSSRGAWPRPRRRVTRAPPPDSATCWGLEELARTGHREPRGEGDTDAAARLRGVLGDLVEACRVVGLAAAPFLPGTAPRLLAQLGHAYPYAADGNGGPPVVGELARGARASEAGRLTAPEPLFPRLDVETVVP